MQPSDQFLDSAALAVISRKSLARMPRPFTLDGQLCSRRWLIWIGPTTVVILQAGIFCHCCGPAVGVTVHRSIVRARQCSDQPTLRLPSRACGPPRRRIVVNE